jgi:tRNA threonylcarbamoyl adenosine modification protein YeaZ
VLLLGLDTATPAVTVAVCDGDRVLAESSAPDDRRHGELLAPAIESVLREAGVTVGDLAGIAVGVGPGPFTGLRVGLVTARMLGAVLGVPVHGVCTLDALALDAGIVGPFRVATDARRKEVYWAAYDGSSALTRVDGPHVDRPAEVAWDGPVVGPGPQLYPDAFPDGRGPVRPSAAALCRWVSEGHPTLDPAPLYLRRPDATEPAPRKTVLGG